MHILLLILGILTTIGIWSWRIQMARRGAKVTMDTARTIANAPRRFTFRYKAGRGGISLIEDPREAAAITGGGFAGLYVGRKAIPRACAGFFVGGFAMHYAHRWCAPCLAPTRSALAPI